MAYYTQLLPLLFFRLINLGCTPRSLLLSLIFTLILVSPSTQTLHFPLTHSLSTTKFTSPHHLLKATTTLSATRHRNRNRNRKQQHQQVSLPLSPGSDYTLTFNLNKQSMSVYMDTGSDVVWFPCSPFDCILCDGKYPKGKLNLLDVNKSSLVSCKSPACSSVHSSLPSSDLCAAAKCPLEDIEISDCKKFACPSFYYAYGDGSFVAQLYRDDLVMPSSNSKKPLSLNNFTFGCANTALGEPIGVAGFGRGSLSLPAQLADMSPELGNQFSYCLVSHSFDDTKLRHPSPLILGKYKEKVAEHEHEHEIMSSFVYTPMLDNPKHPYFYLVGLDAISIGSRRIETPERLKRVDSRGDGGVVVDSGTTYTMMPSDYYNLVADELDRRVGKVFKRATDTESKTGLSPCYELDSKKGSVGLIVPSMVLHFVGNSSSVVLPRSNYFYEFNYGDGGDKRRKTTGKRVGCLMMMDGGDDTESGPGLTLGNYQQQGFEVVYDLEERRVGFARRKCASLWENLNQH